MKAFRLPKKHMAPLATWLNKESLAGKKSRLRTRFVDEIVKSVKELEAERLHLVKKYGKKKKVKGVEQLVTEEENGVKRYVIDDEDAFKKEFDELYEEDFVMSVLPEREEMIEVVKSVVLDTEQKFSGADAREYDAWCEAFEKV